MEVLKIKKDNMAKNNKKKKPTNQDFTNAINQLIQDTQYLYDTVNASNKTFDLYIKFKKETDQFKKYIDTTIKEWQEKENSELQKSRQSNKVTDTANSSN